MRERTRSAAIAALVATSFLAPAASFAEPTPSPSPTVARNQYEQYKIDRGAYLEEIKIRSQQIRFINNVFKESCDKAARDFKMAMMSAKSLDQKNLAANQRKNAVNAAIVARNASINALGDEPTPPIEPAKPLKISNKKKNR